MSSQAEALRNLVAQFKTSGALLTEASVTRPSTARKNEPPARKSAVSHGAKKSDSGDEPLRIG